MLIGVISDTHGLLRSQAVEALRDSDLILHAGDIGKPEVLDGLAALAPVKAVRGNIDRGAWANGLADTQTVQLGQTLVHVLHDLKQLDLSARPGIAAVVSGHTHVARCEWRNQVLYFNPGSAGPRRFRLPVSVGRMRIERRTVRPEIVFLKI